MTIGHHRVRSLMRVNPLRSVWRRKFIHTTNSKHSMPVAANVCPGGFKSVAGWIIVRHDPTAFFLHWLARRHGGSSPHSCVACPCTGPLTAARASPD